MRLEIPFWAGELALAAVWILVRAVLWLRRKRIDRKREALLLLLFVNYAVLLRFAFYPMDTAGGRVQPLVFDGTALLPLRFNLVPYVKLFWHATRRDLVLNLAGNVLLFVPTGILYPALFEKLRAFLRALAAGALLSLFVELLQLPFHVRVSDVDDLLLNTLGVALGYGAWALFRLLRRRREENTALPEKAE